MSSPYIVLISGANRGLGKGLLELYLTRPNHIVIAANRNPDDSTSKALFDLPKGEGSRLVVVKLDATVESDAANAMKELQSQGIDHLDTVIANAGAAWSHPAVRDVTLADLQTMININVFGVVLLYQAALPLLKKAKNPKFVTMGSGAGSLGAQPPIPNASYGASKAMVHWLTKRMNGDEPWLTAFVLNPGWVQTDMGNRGAKALGFGEKAPLEYGETHPGMMKVIDGATKEYHGGKFLSWSGEEIPW